MRVRNNEQDTKQKRTKANGLRRIKVPTACVSGPGYGTLWMGFRGPLGSLRRSFGRVLGRLGVSPGRLESPWESPLASRGPWQCPTGVPGGYGLVLGTSCKVFRELLRVRWRALGVVSRALGGSSGGPWWSLGFSAQLPGQFQNR